MALKDLHLLVASPDRTFIVRIFEEFFHSHCVSKGIIWEKVKEKNPPFTSASNLEYQEGSKHGFSLVTDELHGSSFLCCVLGGQGMNPTTSNTVPCFERE